jgi:hypothetical protein
MTAQLSFDFAAPITEVELAERYRAFNRQWFGGKLVRVRFRISTRMTSTAGLYDIGRREIAVARRFLDMFPEQTDSLLLHEMVHVATRDGHGPKFRREWERLRGAGAPVPEVYRDFRHCLAFAPLRERPYRYHCPVCGEHFARTRPFRGARWCGACVRHAQRGGTDPYAIDRRLVRL